jgi:hypothetical protein
MLAVADRENQFSRVMVDNGIDEMTVREFISVTRNTDELHASIRNLKAELEEASEAVIRLEKQKEERDILIEQLKAESTELNARLSSNCPPLEFTSDRELAELKLENSKLKQECASQEARNAELLVQLLQAESKVSDFLHSDLHSSEQVSRIRQQLTDIQRDFDRVQNEKLDVERDFTSSRRPEQEIDPTLYGTAIQHRITKETLQSVSHIIQSRSTSFIQGIDRVSRSFSHAFASINERLSQLLVTLDQASSPKRSNGEICSAIALLSGFCGKLVNLDASSIPNSDDLIGDRQVLEFFLGRVEAAWKSMEMARVAEIRKLEQKLGDMSKGLSPEIARVVQKMQGTMNELTKVLHDDHKQLIGVLDSTFD